MVAKNLRFVFEGHEDVLKTLRVYERDGTLVITAREDQFRIWVGTHAGRDAIYHLRLPELSAIDHQGHGEINVGAFSVNELCVTLSDHTDTNLNSLNAHHLEVTASDHANVNIETLDSDRVELVSEDYADVAVSGAAEVFKQTQVGRH
ncbi:MAG: DUF2807 domain-containing protein [Pseudomonadales bacterium]|nr:DUF2807 domain-containing protein [Pseudomonadales bacterium]MDP6470595.1 DUF2807 domain-containing protein [Pseudomonadales bacterium]MDP6828550.1 DUF2807 domain-containing protein [Pseudomonadales bacterium]MDP6972036.1 DUF2807 domain-containing protein [Pseudomonadales bacterium]